MNIIFSIKGNGGYDQMNPMHDYSQNYANASNQPGYNTNGYSQYAQTYSQQVEYDHSQGYSHEYKWIYISYNV